MIVRFLYAAPIFNYYEKLLSIANKVSGHVPHSQPFLLLTALWSLFAELKWRIPRIHCLP